MFKSALIGVLAGGLVVALALSCGDTVTHNDGGSQGDSGLADGSTDGSTPDAAVADAGPDAASPDAGSDAGIDDSGSDTGVNPDTGVYDASVDSGMDGSSWDAGLPDVGAGDGGTADGSVKISKFGFVNISYSEGVKSSSGNVSGTFYGYYKPGKSGGGGGWVGPDLDDCVVVPPYEPCNPPDCTPPEYQLSNVGDVTITGFVSAPIKMQMSEKAGSTGIYYPDGDPAKSSIQASEFSFDSEYSVAGQGSGEFGAFSAKLVAPKKLKLLDPTECGSPFLPTDSALIVKWEGGAGGLPIYLTFSTVAYVGKVNKSWSVFCQVINDGEFTIKQKYMVQLPTANVVSQQVYISKSVSSKFDIPGMDYGYFSFSASSFLTCN
jgi:hypothetical protein